MNPAMDPIKVAEGGEGGMPGSVLPMILAGLRRHRLSLCVFTGLGAVLGGLIGVTRPNQYQSVGKLFVRADMRESLASYALVTGADATSRMAGGRESVQTAMQVLSAPELIDKVIERVGLDELLSPYDPTGNLKGSLPWYTAAFHAFQSWWFDVGSASAALQGEERLRVGRSLLANSLRIVPESGASVIAFTGVSHSPQLAQVVVNSALDVATEWYREVFRSMSSLSELEEEARSKGELALEAEKALRDFRIEHGINDYEAQHDGLVRYIDEINQRVDTVDIELKGKEAERADLATQLKDIKPRRNVAGAQSVVLNPTYSRLNEILGTLWNAVYELDRAEGDVSAKKDRKDKLDRQIAQVEERLRQENVQVHLPGPEEDNPDYVRTVQRVAELDSAMKRLQSERGQLVVTRDASRARLRQIEDQAPRLRVLEEDFRQKRTFADRLAGSVHDERAMQRLDQMKLSEVRVMHYGALEDQKISPRRGQLLALGAFGGIVAGLALVTLLSLRDRSIRVAGDLVRLGVPRDGVLLAAVASKTTAACRLPDSLADCRDDIARFWAALPYDRRSTDCLRIAFLPTGASANAARAAASLAVGLAAHGGERVVYVPTCEGPTWLAQRLGLGDPRGWSETVRGEIGLEEAVVPTPIVGLDYLPVGKVGAVMPHPMSSAGFSALLDRLVSRYRFVIIELPDLGRMPEGRSVLGVVDAVQLVVRMGITSKVEVQDSMAAIATSGVRLLGAIVQSERSPADGAG